MAKTQMMTVKGASTTNLYLVQCPKHGIGPVGFFQQLPYKMAADGRTVTVTIKCHKCDFATERTYDLEPSPEDAPPEVIDQSSYTGALSSNSFVTTVLFYKHLGVVLRAQVYDNGNSHIVAYGGDLEKQEKAKARFEEWRKERHV